MLMFSYVCAGMILCVVALFICATIRTIMNVDKSEKATDLEETTKEEANG